MNGEGLATRVRDEIARARRYGRAFAVLVVEADAIDVPLAPDGSEEVAAWGDALETALRASLRDVDHVARLAAGRVAVLLPETGAAGARAVGERIRGLAPKVLVKTAPIGARPALPFKTTCSTGIAVVAGEGAGPDDDPIARAQSACARARGSGGDRIET